MDSPRRIQLAAAISFLATITLYLLGSAATGLRFWGISVWGYLPSWAILIPGIAGILGLAVLFYPFKRPPTVADLPGAGEWSRQWARVLIAFGPAGVGAIMWAMRARTHFLGDGYQNLHRLAQGFPQIKATEFGTEVTLLCLWNMIGARSISEALLAYQIAAVASGILFTALVIWTSLRLFGSWVERMLFGIGLMSGGFMLLFFGYVEHYALLVLSVAAYTLLGLCALRGRLPRWPAVASAVFAVFFHVIALVLIPSLVYLLFHDTRIGKRIGELQPSTKWLLALAIAAVGVGGYLMVSSNNLFLRLAVISPVPNRFSLPGYLLFSAAHLLDFANLLLILAPPCLLVAAVAMVNKRRESLSLQSYTFLYVLGVPVLLSAFMLDPKLGMPRDWDLFAVAGIPLTALMYLYLLERLPSRRLAVSVMVAAGILGIVGLAPQVVRQAHPESSVAYLVDCIELDPARNRNAYLTLWEYLRDQGQTARADSVKAVWDRRYPERRFVLEGQQRQRAGDIPGARKLYLQALVANPRDFDAYNNLGDALLKEKRYDSALVLLRIAQGLNPGSFSVLHNMASAYFYKGELDRAAKLWEQAVAIDSTNYQPYVNLMRLYQGRGDQDQYSFHLRQAARCENAPEGVRRELIEYYLRSAKYAEAKEAMREGLLHGMDTAWVASQLKVLPPSATGR